MKTKISLLLFALALAGSFCGATDELWMPTAYVNDWPVATDITEEEIEILTRVIRAFEDVQRLYPQYAYLKIPPDQSLIVVRDPWQKIPKVCVGVIGCIENCADRWVQVPDVYDSPARIPELGYGGLETDLHVFVNRAKCNTYKKFLAIVRHEYVHAVSGLHHGPAFDALNDLVRQHVLMN